MANRLISKKKTILLVDDDEKIRALLREIIGPRKYRILEAQDGQEALDLIHKETVHLVITDRAMPRMDGIELLKKLRDEGREIPSVMVSAYGDEELWGTAIGLGAEDYILKPFSTDSVMKIVKKKLK